MNTELGGYCQIVPESYFKLKIRLFQRWSWPYTSKVAFWLSQKLKHTDSPEYYQRHRFLAKWLGGLYVACWTHVCGDDIRRSLHIGNIYWKLGMK